nr:uncharacterized protein LOC112015507 [Quercus suber]
MAGQGQQPAESGASQHIDPFLNLERRQDREGSVHTTHTERTQPRSGSRVLHAEKTNMQIEIDRLKRELRHEKRKRTVTLPDDDWDDGQDIPYEPNSQTPISETFSYEAERPREKRSRGPPYGGVGNDAMSKALSQISRSPFTRRIEGAEMPRRFTQPTFTIYNGKTDPVEHVFPSSLGPVAMRWFDNLRADSIDSYQELTQAFGSRFVTCRRVPRPLSSLLSLSMREGETLKAYSDRYWEMFNEMEGNFDAMALETFKLGLPTDHGLRTSLSGKPVVSMRQLMDRIEKYKRVEEDRQQEKGSAGTQAVNTVFKEPVQQVLDKVKSEPFFRWPNKMVGNPDRRNRNVYCQYHQDHGHTTEDCRSLWDHLDQLVGEGRLKHLLHRSSGRGLPISDAEKGDSAKPPLGVINVIFAAPGRTGCRPSKVMSVAQLPVGDADVSPKSPGHAVPLVLGFSNEDKAGTIQPHEDALVVTLRIGGYDVKRVMVDQGSAVEIMYPDLFRGLNLVPSDLTPYCSSLISFEGRMVMPKGQIRLPVQTGSEIVEVDFVVVDVYSPYTAIVARPWLHTLGAVSSTLHQKIKYPSEGRVCEIRGDQSSARQCLVTAIRHGSEDEPSEREDKNL